MTMCGSEFSTWLLGDVVMLLYPGTERPVVTINHVPVDTSAWTLGQTVRAADILAAAEQLGIDMENSLVIY